MPSGRPNNKVAKQLISDLGKARRTNVNILEFAEALVGEFGGPEKLAELYVDAWQTSKPDMKRHYLLHAVKLIQNVTEIAGVHIGNLTGMTNEDLQRTALEIMRESGLDVDTDDLDGSEQTSKPDDNDAA